MFGFDNDKPGPAWIQYIGSFSTLELAKENIDNLEDWARYDRYQVLAPNLDTGELDLELSVISR
jgi:hypothetical protein